ncbi:MAG: tRNA (adenosine(37)-N6)-dimethylallyltransferase MiaA [bacterium]|nr:tRNA (adenosine(37)-N6)-dimethylallyltransferase MiaA [bacterium]
MKNVPFIVGPTASGKTSISLLVAKRLQAQIISADSRQLYRHMAIGTAQPTASELRQVPHHFIACIDPQNRFSAGEYGRQARAKIAELLDAGIIPLAVGGSGLYVSALADDFFAGPSADPEIRDRLKSAAAEKGVEHLYQQLQEIDPLSAAKILPGDYRRIERALEIYYLTGIPISQLRRQSANPPPFKPVMLGLDWPRADLYDRINSRCLQMLEQGLIEEVKSLSGAYGDGQKSIHLDINALNSVGYVEVRQYLQNEIDYNEMVRLFQRNTRRFAKRQLSWFRRDDRIRWIAMTASSTPEETAEAALKIFHEAGIWEGCKNVESGFEPI